MVKQLNVSIAILFVNEVFDLIHRDVHRRHDVVPVELANNDDDHQEPFILLRPSSLPPTPAQNSEGAAGFHLHADLGDGQTQCGQVVVIPPGERAFIGTGVAFMLPPGTYGRVAPRTGVPLAFGIDVVGGLILPNYRGEVKIILVNESDKAFAVHHGDRVAQLVLEKFPNFDQIRLLSVGGTPR